MLYGKVAAERDVDDLADVDQLVLKLKDAEGSKEGLDW